MTLYNGQTAREAARDGKPVIVVEGYLDVIAAVTAGFEGTVAPLGTALTEEHVQLLWRMSDAPILCFDGDSAGQRAAERAAEMVLPLLQPGQTVKIATLPEGLDPDDLIKAQGREAFADVIDRARSLSDVVWSLETRRHRAGNAGGAGGARGAAARRGPLRSARQLGAAALHAGVRREAAGVLRAGRGSSRFERRRQRRRYGQRQAGYGQTATASAAGARRALVVSDTLRNSRLLKPGRRPTRRRARRRSS